MSTVVSVTLCAVPIECVCEATIKASPAECFEVAADAGRWREWARDLEEVEVLTPFADGTPMRVAIVIEVLGVQKGATIDVARDPDAHTLTFDLVESASLDSFAGHARIQPDGTRSRMAVEVRATMTRARGPRIDRLVSRKLESAITRDFVRYVERTHRGR
jgi:cytochrome P450